MKRLIKGKRLAVTVVLSLSLVSSMASNVFAYSYNLNIPTPYLQSMQSTACMEKTSATTPYVQSSKRTIPTNYFLSPKRKSSLAATNVITKSNASRSDFTWESNYGGLHTDYCLSAYPNTTADYDAYNVSGTWSN